MELQKATLGSSLPLNVSKLAGALGGPAPATLAICRALSLDFLWASESNVRQWPALKRKGRLVPNVVPAPLAAQRQLLCPIWGAFPEDFLWASESDVRQ